jgi:hypothetical protein
MTNTRRKFVMCNYVKGEFDENFVFRLSTFSDFTYILGESRESSSNFEKHMKSSI